ncbi:LysR family transcriptional regulator [Piscinibacter sakaiensis]|uniref:LysR family transcriptional regulator n=1 Tax=Piscinibacter sakaiensis TaxID=1547922 RepID=UPI003AAE37E8
MLNATWLETFTTLCETGSLTRTAERLHMTQPGVSQHLHKLEDRLGCKLLSRDGKSFTLTPAGERLLALGLSRRREERQVLEEIRVDDPDVGQVAVACSGSFALLLYPRLLDHSAPRAQLSIALEAAPQPAILQGVLDGRFDIGVLHHDPSHPRIAAERVGAEELCLVLPADEVGRNRKKGTTPTFEALEQRGFIGHPDGPALAELLLGPNYPGEFSGGDRLRLRGYVNQIGQIPAPVAQGIGYTILPESGIAAFPQRERLRVVPLAQRVHHELWLVMRKGRELAQRIGAVAEIVGDTARGIGAGISSKRRRSPVGGASAPIRDRGMRTKRG